MRAYLLIVFTWTCTYSFGQFKDLPPAKVTLADVEMTSYPKDTSATAVVLNELGHSFVSDEAELQLVFQYYIKIKVLKQRGVEQGDFEIPLHKQTKREETFVNLVASTYNLENGKMKETRLTKKWFVENSGKYTNKVKFAMPDVRVGSVIEVRYELHSPFIYNFRTWYFQSEIPKAHSEYWCLIPGIYVYNTSIKGFLRLKKNEQSLIKNCMEMGAAKIECSMSKYAIDDIPAMLPEEHMTAMSNFRSSLNFELSEIRHLTGAVEKVTKEWKDVDLEMRQDESFGVQLRKARNQADELVPAIVGQEKDTLKNAIAIYQYVRDLMTWNGHYGQFTDLGVKKALETKTGNAADINLFLIGAMQSAGIDAYPVLLSTRENGLATELFPVISDFNYVVGTANIAGKQYFFDATSDFRPFGMLPIRCMNGKGRLMTKESRWIELKARDKFKTTITATISLSPESCKGMFARRSFGYDAVNRRAEIDDAGDTAKYLDRVKKEFKKFEVVDCELENLKSLDEPLGETMNIVIPNEQSGGPIYLNPFISGDWEKNPFKSTERLFPVDFGAPIEETYTINVNYPESYVIDEMPASTAFSLPQSGGRYLLNVSNLGNRLTITSNLTLNKAVYSSADYPYLKELFARLIQIQASQVVFKKK